MKKDFTEEQFLDAYATSMEAVLDVDLEDSTIPVFRQLLKVKGLDEYLRAQMGKDIQRYFIAKDDKERERVRGAYQRTFYLRAMLKKVADMDEAMKLKESRTER